MKNVKAHSLGLGCHYALQILGVLFLMFTVYFTIMTESALSIIPLFAAGVLMSYHRCLWWRSKVQAISSVRKIRVTK